MKKKKLKKHIVNLELQLAAAKQRAHRWEDIYYQFIGELKKQRVNVESVSVEPTIIEVSGTEDDVAKYAYGISAAPPALSFDFSEHDKKVILNHGTETCEKWRRIWRDMND